MFKIIITYWIFEQESSAIASTLVEFETQEEADAAADTAESLKHPALSVHVQKLYKEQWER